MEDKTIITEDGIKNRFSAIHEEITKAKYKYLGEKATGEEDLYKLEAKTRQLEYEVSTAIEALSGELEICQAILKSVNNKTDEYFNKPI